MWIWVRSRRSTGSVDSISPCRPGSEEHAMRYALASLMLFAPAAFAQAAPGVPPGEEAVDPYVQSNANAGASPFAGKEMLAAFHGRDGIGRIVDDLVDHVRIDPRIEEIFKATDLVRLRRTLKEQVCYIL